MSSAHRRRQDNTHALRSSARALGDGHPQGCTRTRDPSCAANSHGMFMLMRLYMMGPHRQGQDTWQYANKRQVHPFDGPLWQQRGGKPSLLRLRAGKSSAACGRSMLICDDEPRAGAMSQTATSNWHAFVDRYEASQTSDGQAGSSLQAGAAPCMWQQHAPKKHHHDDQTQQHQAPPPALNAMHGAKRHTEGAGMSKSMEPAQTHACMAKQHVA